MAICWERAVPLAFHLCCFYFCAVFVVRVPFPFDVWGRVWNSIVSVPDHCLFIFFDRMRNSIVSVILIFINQILFTMFLF